MVSRSFAVMLGRLGDAARAHPYAVVAASSALGLLLGAAWVGPADLFASPDQRGRWHFERGDYRDAAATFTNSLWRGIALFRSGEFKQTAQVLGGLDTAQAAYDEGNALVMLGQYNQAVQRYSRALELRPDWPDAEANRTLARLRAARMRTEGGDSGDTESSPDEVVYDRTRKNAGQGEGTEAASGAAMSDEGARALWLRRVQTRPADFLRAKFSYQLQNAPAVAPEERRR
ncbi:tetratricopeptide repeat protein [Methylobacterium nigriterrae]|uniref:tetratricopeptide repeat protein n=1 Tax=Methylobacterium nigriterrae TaxID=3127512 RepID=UPI003013297A